MNYTNLVINIGTIIGLIIIQISNVLCVEIWYDNMESITDWSRTIGSSVVSTGCSSGNCLYFTPGFEMQRSTDVTEYENLYFVYYFYGLDIRGTGILIYCINIYQLCKYIKLMFFNIYFRDMHISIFH